MLMFYRTDLQNLPCPSAMLMFYRTDLQNLPCPSAMLMFYRTDLQNLPCPSAIGVPTSGDRMIRKGRFGRVFVRGRGNL
jgi:hypothetical protein